MNGDEADANAKLRNGNTPTHVTARCMASFEVWKELLTCRADPFLQDEDGETPLDFLDESDDELRERIVTFISEMEALAPSPTTTKKPRLD
ncbi:hypothetical protein FI667_g8348, partial [Globisporangium splendens]